MSATETPAPAATTPEAPAASAAPALGTSVPATSSAPEATPPSDSVAQGIINYDAFLSQVPEEFRGEAALANIDREQPLADMVKQFVNAQKLLGRPHMPRPNDKTTDEEWNQIYEAIGRPKDSKSYVKPELPEGVQFEDEQLTAFQEYAHNLGLTQKQFEGLLKFQADSVSQSIQGQTAAQQATLQQYQETLSKEWGIHHKTNLDIANAAFEKLADPSLKELVSSDPTLSNHPGLLKLFHSIGREMLEDTPHTGRSESLHVGGAASAKVAIAKLEEEHRDVLYDPDYRGPKNREDIIAQRTALYKKAFPSENSE